MPRVPLYSGQIASAVMPHSFTPRETGLFSQQRGGSVGAETGSLLRRIFMGPEADPQRELARKYGAEADLEEKKLADAKIADTARTGLSSVFDELLYREGLSANGRPTEPIQLTEEVPYEPPPQTGPAPDRSALMARAAGSHLTRALGAGADPAQTTPLMRAFALATGGDDAVTRVNSALDAKYLGDNQSPSLAAQREKIEDAQRQELEKQEMIELTKKYGFDTASADRRYDIEVDAATARRGQDVSASTSRANTATTAATTRRGQDMVDARAREAAGFETVTEEYPATKPTKGKSKFLGIFGDEEPARPGTPKRKVTRKVPIKGDQKADPLGIR